MKDLHCNFAHSISRLGIFRCVFIVGRFWLSFNVKCVTFLMINFLMILEKAVCTLGLITPQDQKIKLNNYHFCVSDV